MSLSLTDLLTPTTADSARATMVATLEGLGVPASQWRKGGVLSTLLTVLAITYAGFTTTLVAAIGAGFLENATGGWLILLAYYVYGVIAIPATFATGQLTLTNSGGGVFTYAAGQATFLNPTTKIQYTNVSPFTLSALSSLTIDIVATTKGSIGSSAPGTITQLVTVMLNVTCTNAAAVVGQDAEKDPDLRLRCLQRLAALSVRGPRNAYAWAAKSALRSDGSNVNINRVAVSPSSSTGVVTVYCASPSGAPTSSDLAAAAANIEANVRPDAVTANVNAVTTVAYSQSITVWAVSRAGLVASDLAAKCETAINTYIASYPIGGLTNGDSGVRGLFGSGISSILGALDPAIFATDVGGATLPDLALTDGQVATNNTTVIVRLAASP